MVAIGEGCHFVAEFGALRRRILRFLAERCGFTVLGFEFGLAEAIPLGQWLQGTGTEADLAGYGGTPNVGLNGAMARWLRRHNATSEHPLRLIGVDVPDAGGEVRPALDPLAHYLREVDPDVVERLKAALEIADRVTGHSVAVAAPRWGGLERAEQDRLTALLARLLVRMQALEPLYVSRSSQHGYDLARRHLEAAVHTDYMFGAMNDIFAGHGLPADASVRDAYMASSLRWHLKRLEPGTRVVLAAHNAHIQKTPAYYDGELAALPMGHYLAEVIGGDYRAIALTHTADSVPEMYPDGSPETGFTVSGTFLDPPSAGSIEGALVAAGLGARPTLTDLRPLAHRSDGQPGRIRSQSDELELPVATAFDAALSVPTITPEITTALA